MKKRSASLVVLAAIAFAACGDSSESICRARAAIDCERMYTCNTATKVGSDVAGCTTSLGALCALGAGTADVNAAQQCNVEKKAQTCEQYIAGQPASCQ